MNDLMQCSACGGKVSQQAKACPHCGHPVPQQAQPNQSNGDGCYIFLAIIVLVFVAGCLLSWCEDKKGPKKVSSRSSDGSIVMEKTQIGCLDMDDYLRLRNVGSSGDDEAYSKLRAGLVGLGRCDIIPKGSVVYREKDSVKHRVVRIRKKGETATWWTEWVYQQ